MTPSDIDYKDIDLTDSKAYVPGVPHEWFSFLRKNAPVWWQEEKDGPGFWAVTGYEDCNTVNRDYSLFSSHAKRSLLFDMDEEQLALHDHIHAATDAIIDDVIEAGRADFVTDISAELPLVGIADLLGVPNEDR